MKEAPASCLPFDEDLSAFVDEELPAEREAELRDHLDTCARCAGRLEELCNVDLALASLPAPQVPGDLRARLAARLAAGAAGPEEEEVRAATPAPAPRLRARSAPPRRRRRALAAAASVAAAATAVLALWLALRSDDAVAPPTPIAVAPAVPEPAAAPVVPEPAEEGLELAQAGLPELEDLAEADVALLLEIDAVEDLDVIANLDLLERYLALEARRGAG